METDRKYLVAVALLAVLAVAFGVFGTFAPLLAEESTPIQPQQESPSGSVGHFQNPPTYDSGWVDIRDKAGKEFDLTHDLGTTDVFVYMTGSTVKTVENEAWNQSYGRAGLDFGYSVVQTADGGYALAGYTDSGAGNYDFLLVKTDSSGNFQWNQTYGGSGLDVPYSVIQTTDGGYALAGSTNSSGAGKDDMWLVKVDSSGSSQWNKTFGRAANDAAHSLVQTPDDGYAMAGYSEMGVPTFTDAWLVKTDSYGNMLWNRTYDYYAGSDYIHSLIQTTDGGFALAGEEWGYGYGDFLLIKTDSSGNKQWSREGGWAPRAIAYSVAQTIDGAYILAGYATQFSGAPNFWLMKLIGSQPQWFRTYGGAGLDIGHSLTKMPDGGYAIAGYTNSYGAGGYDFWLIRTDSTGSIQANQTYGGSGWDEAFSMIRTTDGCYAIAGYTGSYGAGNGDIWLVKVNEQTTPNSEHQRNLGADTGLVWTNLTNTTIRLRRGATDLSWMYVRVRMWLIKEPSWIYGDINMDGVVDGKDLYILGRNYGKSVSLLSLGGIIGIAGIRTVRKRKQAN